MQELTRFVNDLVSYASSSHHKFGIAYFEVIGQYCYPGGFAGIYYGTTSTPFRCSDDDDNWIIPSSGILKLGGGQTETSIKSNLNLIFKVQEKESIVSLVSFDLAIKHIGQNISLCPNRILLAETGAPGKEKGTMIINYLKVKKPLGLKPGDFNKPSMEIMNNS